MFEYWLILQYVLLELFKLDYNFSGEDLKKAKIICLQTHPDKGGNEQLFFIATKDINLSLINEQLVSKKEDVKSNIFNIFIRNS